MSFPPPPSHRMSLLSLLSGIANTPSKWTKNYEERMMERLHKRFAQLKDRIDSVAPGHVVPDLDDLNIGGATQHRLAILFLDICGFSSIPNWNPEEQKEVLARLNLFMSEMITVVRDFEGHFEKNTGDGLMSYFGEGTKTDAERVKPAVEAAAIMHYFNDNILGPLMDSYRVPRLKFRVGIDVGPVTLARVGIKSADSDYSSVVAIGTIANLACKLMKLIPDGGICVGQNAYAQLPNNWASRCAKASPTGFVYVESQQPYPAWILNYRLMAPSF